MDLHPSRPRAARRLAFVLVAGALLGLTACGASEPEAGPTTCEYPTSGSDAVPVDPPPETPTAEGTVTSTITTNHGELALSLDADGAPCTVSSFLSLAEQGYYDGTECHRLTTEGIFVLQCGDPTGTGSGGPGYSFADELDGSESYPAGTLAMANSGPDTNGSQFFIVYDDSRLPPDYTVFGSLDEASTATVADIAAAGTDTGAGDGAPKEAVAITEVTAP